MPETTVKVCTSCGRRFHSDAAFCQLDGAPLVSEEETPDPYIGRVLLDQFRIEELLGVGGMGSVYRARQTTLDRDVAIKILHQDLNTNPDAVRRFRREAKIATRLDHPNVVRVYLFGQLPDGSLYLVMEFLEGRPLSDLLHSEGRVLLPRALHIATQIADGVGEAHAHSVVHRDVKPENVLIVRRGRDDDFVKVLDFGIARLLRDEQTVATQSGLIFGTARYISPEGAAGEPTDSRSDVYSIGVLTYQLLCGEAPFEAPSPVAMLMKHIHEAPKDVRLRAGGSGIPAPVAEVVMQALAKDPAHRFPDAAAYGEALRGAASMNGLELSARYRTSFAPSYTPTPPPPSPVAFSPTLAAAPSPFGSTTSIVPAPPPRGPGVGVVPTVLLAFLLGAAAVTSGAWLVGALDRRPSLPVTAPVPSPSPLPPQEIATQMPPREEPREPGIRIVPERPIAGQAVTLVAVLPPDVEIPDGAEPGFRLWRDGRRIRGQIPAAQGPDHTWIGSTVLAQAGRYDIRLQYGKGRASTRLLQMTVRVEPAPRGQRGDGPVTTQVRAPPAAAPTMFPAGGGTEFPDPELAPPPPPQLAPQPQAQPDNIWPPPIEPAPTAMDQPPPAPPAPWTGQVL